MDGVNALLARGVGADNPAWDYNIARNNALRNRILEQQIEAEPFRRELDERYIRLQELAMDVRAKAAEQKDAPGPISIDYDWGTITGTPQSVSMVADAVARFPEQTQDPQFMPWVAQQGVSFKKKEIKPTEEKSKTEEQLTRTALRQAYKREPTDQEILDAMQKRKIETAKAMPAPTVYVGTTEEGKPIVTGGTKGKPEFKTPEIPEGGKIGPKPSKLPAEEQKSLQSLDELMKTSDEIEKMFKGVESKIGPIAGRWNVIKSKFMDNPDFVTFKSTLGQLRTIVYGISGKQINESELDWLKNDILPALESPGKNFLATLRAFRNWAKKKHEGLNEQFKASGYVTGAESSAPKTIGRFTIEVE